MNQDCAESFKCSKTLTFEFDNADAAYRFKVWLSESGEQDYWNWLEYDEMRFEENITGIRFDYHTNDKIKVECSRLDLPDHD